ncbi:NYN domain-containing protein [Rhodococcus sp. DN22]|uniref:NYN domain-containing protein n=1 Tax=Rhodococcus sp. DN22 TaxID=357684 RepID=UPI0030CC66A5
MRSTCSLYVDTGYLLASAATRVTGTSLRSGIHVDYASIIASLISEAEIRSGLPLLRVHWYDSARHGVPDARQERIGELSRVKLRLGRFGVNGEQKGVDLRIGLDLVTHARNNASDIFFLVSGDDDLTEAVEEAQVHGVQVVLLAVPTKSGAPHGVSRHLVRAADEIDTIDGSVVDSAVMKVDRQPQTAMTDASVAATPERQPCPTPMDLARGTRGATTAPRKVTQPAKAIPAYSGSTGHQAWIAPNFVDGDLTQDTIIDKVVASVLESFRNSTTQEKLVDLELARPSIPPEIDRALLRDVSDAMQVDDLDERIRHQLRARFWLAFGNTE